MRNPQFYLSVKRPMVWRGGCAGSGDYFTNGVRAHNWHFWDLSMLSLHWRHNELDGVSNHQPHDCLLTCLFRHISKKTSKLRVTGLCEGNSPGTGEFPAQKASNAENVSIWWRHHVIFQSGDPIRSKFCICHDNDSSAVALRLEVNRSREQRFLASTCGIWEFSP